jgi:two-component system, LytTR family, sensor kinase
MKKHPPIYHFLFWLLAYTGWIFVFGNNALALTRTVTIQFCYLLFIAANYYFNTVFNIPTRLDKKKYIEFGILFILGIVITAAIRVPLSFYLTTYLFGIKSPHFNYLSVFCDSFINILFWVVLILAGKMISDKIRSELYIAKIEKEKDTNELNFLRAQFNPHFLFNSINSIYGHIDKTNKPAREMLLKFSEMLRYQLYECNVDKIELDRELNYIENYIILQRTRMNERICIESRYDLVDGKIKIAPLLLIIFIENAFKYVSQHDNSENFIRIHFEQVNRDLHFSIVNTKDGSKLRSIESPGLGIGNAQRRLELLYPDRHQLKVNNGREQFAVDLTLFDL